jgi:hypothetical protein
VKEGHESLRRNFVEPIEFAGQETFGQLEQGKLEPIEWEPIGWGNFEQFW